MDKRKEVAYKHGYALKFTMQGGKKGAYLGFYLKVSACIIVLLVLVRYITVSKPIIQSRFWRSDDELIVKVTNVNLRPKPNSEEMHDKWIVVTTIFPPTDDIKKLAALPGWKVVVVGDKKTPSNWSHPNCVFLDTRKQEDLKYRINEFLKYNSYARKNIGFMYAIERGAKIIYETDDDNSPTKGIIFDMQLQSSYLIYQKSATTNVVNPYSHFGQSTVWPRGFPLGKISDSENHMFKECSQQRAIVQQGLVDGDPDVDAIFRLTRKDDGVRLDLKFDPDAKPVLLPKGYMSPYNCQNTLHLYDAFWGLLLPQTVAFRVTDIWRGYWAQRLLWEIDGYLSFFTSNAYTVRSAHSYHADFKDELDMYTKSGDLVDFLCAWKPKSISLPDKVIELSLEMSLRNFWREGDVVLSKAWIEDLISIGYEFPTSRQTRDTCSEPVQLVAPKEQPSSYLRGGERLRVLEKI